MWAGIHKTGFSLCFFTFDNKPEKQCVAHCENPRGIIHFNRLPSGTAYIPAVWWSAM